jgi:hypothetical protein
VSYRALFLSVGLALVWTIALVWVLLPRESARLRLYVADTGRESYRVEAHEARVEGFCTVFVRDGQRVAAVCGTHTWSETTEVR